MTPYLELYVLPVQRARLEEYRKLAHVVSSLKMELGALSSVEVVEDDVKSGVLTSFPQAVKLEEGEVVVVGIDTFASRAERDRILAAAMADPRCAEMVDVSNMPFDPKRMFWGGFAALVAL